MKFRSIILLLAGFFTVSAQAIEISTVKVTGDRVSMRTKPSVEGKLINRAMRNQTFDYLEQENGWYAVQAPASIDLWVYGKLIENGVVQSDTAYVRSEPKRLKSTHVCVINKGDFVSERAEVDGWLKIAPPTGCRLWISGDYSERINQTISSANVKAPEPAVMPLAKPVSMPLANMVLDNTMHQGSYDEVNGILRQTATGNYNLVQRYNGSEKVVYRVSGDKAELELYLNHALSIKGKKYWAKGETLPFIDLESIKLGSKS